MKRKIGDKVRVRKDLVVGSVYDSFAFSNDMVQYLGKYAEIADMDDVSYTLDIDNCSHYWTEEMLEDTADYAVDGESIPLDKLADIIDERLAANTDYLNEIKSNTHREYTEGEIHSLIWLKIRLGLKDFK